MTTHALMYRVKSKEGDEVFFVRATNREGPPAVHGFESEDDASLFLEEGYARTHGRGATWSAGATLHWLGLSPRVFRFESLAHLAEICGDPVQVETLSSEAVHELVIRCGDQAVAARVYERSREVRLVPRVH